MTLSHPVEDIASELRAIAARFQTLCQDRFGERLASEEFGPMLQRVQDFADELAASENQLQCLVDDMKALVESLP